MNNNLLYYSIFLLISGTIHYVVCFWPVEEIEKVKISPEIIKAAIMQEEKKEEEKKEEEKKEEEKTEEEKKEEEKKEEEKKEEEKREEEKKELQKIIEEQKKQLEEQKILYQENLEKKLNDELTEKLKKIEAEKQKELNEVKDELTKEQQEKQKELEKQKQEQQKLNQDLLQKLAQINEKMQDIKQLEKKQKNEFEERFQELEAKKQQELVEMERQRKKDLEKIEQKQVELEATKKNLENLAQKTQEERQELKEKAQENEDKLNKYKEKLLIAMNRKLKQQQENNKAIIEETLEKEKEKLAEQKQQLEYQIIKQTKLLDKLRNSSKSNKEAQEREIINKQWSFLEKVRIDSLDQHEKYIRNFSTSSEGETVVPALDFFSDAFYESMPHVMNFHKMELIAYPSNMAYFILVDLNKPKSMGRYDKRTDISYFQNFNKRTISIDPDVISNISSEIAYSSLYSRSDGNLKFFMLLPHKTANYIAWKQNTVCKKYGYDPKDVRINNSYFTQTRHGYWSLVITDLRLKDGSLVQVEDFEEKW